MDRRSEYDTRKELWLRRENSDIQLVLKYLHILLDEGKRKLVEETTPANFPIVQGQAKAYQTLITAITRQTPEIGAKQE